MTTLAERLQASLSEKGRSYHRILRDATHEIRRAVLDRPWSEVEPELQSQGLPQIRVRDHQHTSEYRHLITTEEYRGGDKPAHTVFLELTVDRRQPNQTSDTKPGVVMVAVAGTLIELNCPYKQVVASGAFFTGSVLYHALRLLEVEESTERYPIVKTIEVNYDFIRDFRSESTPQGFGINITLGMSEHDNRRGKDFLFTAESGLDSPQDWHGNPLQQDFQPQDVFYDFRKWGGGEWRRDD